MKTILGIVALFCAVILVSFAGIDILWKGQFWSQVKAGYVLDFFLFYGGAALLYLLIEADRRLKENVKLKTKPTLIKELQAELCTELKKQNYLRCAELRDQINKLKPSKSK